MGWPHVGSPPGPCSHIEGTYRSGTAAWRSTTSALSLQQPAAHEAMRLLLVGILQREEPVIAH